MITVDLKNIKQTAPYEGGEFNQQRAGQVTFKVKKKEVTSGKHRPNVLLNEEIQRISEAHEMSRAEIYDVHSTFSSMCRLSKMWIETQPHLIKDK